jgi:hypothetical protein
MPGAWWRRQGRWKWWMLGFAALVIVGAASKTNSPSTTGTAQVTQQSTSVLAEHETEEKQNKLREREHEIEERKIKLGEQKERHEEEQKKNLKESIEHQTFVATDASVRQYLSDELIGEKLRKVSCHMETECTVALDDYTPQKAGKITTFLGLGRSTTEQLFEDPDKIFAALFADGHMQEATVIPWVELETNGGKGVRWPAIRVVCDASAAKQIDWDRVSPTGIEELCKVTLLPNGPPPQ